MAKYIKTINGNLVSSNNPSITDVGILTVQNSPIVDSDNINTFASKTQSQIDDLAARKADRPNGVLSGGDITTGVDFITVSATTWSIALNNYSSSTITFNSIALSSSGNQRYIAIYGDTSNVINKLEGNEATLAVYPDLPLNTIIIGYVLVGDGVISSPAPDLSAYATTNWAINWAEPKILISTRTTNYRLNGSNYPSQIIRNGGTVDIGIQPYYTGCKINGQTTKTIVVKPNQFAFIKAIQNNDDNYFVFVVDEIPVSSIATTVGNRLIINKTTSWSITQTDVNSAIAGGYSGITYVCNSTTDGNFTVPVLTVPLGFTIRVHVINTGMVTVVASSTTVNSRDNLLKSVAQHSAFELEYIATNIYQLAGDLV